MYLDTNINCPSLGIEPCWGCRYVYDCSIELYTWEIKWMVEHKSSTIKDQIREFIVDAKFNRNKRDDKNYLILSIKYDFPEYLEYFDRLFVLI